MSDLIILEKTIRQQNGLYCLNDLHRASGGKETDKPVHWLKSKQTIELIEELNKVRNLTLEQNQQVIKTVKGGNQAGTYACRELVLAYATWISPPFFLEVLRTFDRVALSGSLKPHLPPICPDANLLSALNVASVRPPRNLAEANALFRQIDALEMQVGEVYRHALFARMKLGELQRNTQSWRDYWQIVENFAR